MMPDTQGACPTKYLVYFVVAVGKNCSQPQRNNENLNSFSFYVENRMYSLLVWGRVGSVIELSNFIHMGTFNMLRVQFCVLLDVFPEKMQSTCLIQ